MKISMMRRVGLTTLSMVILSLFSNAINAQVSQFFGTTSDGGQDKEGAIYKTDGNGENFELLYNFVNLDIQDVRYVQMVEATDGKLYGTSLDGGDFADGTIFEYDPASGTSTVLFSFDNTIEGRSPFGGLIQATDGLLYGLLCYGGATDDGIIYAYEIATGTLTIRHTFNGTDGERPQSTLMQASDGLLYGTTRFGGANNDGVIFSFDPLTDTYTKLFDFDQPVSGDRPYSGVVEATNGLLYGATFTGGVHDDGVLFSYDPVGGAYTVIHEMLDSVTVRKPYGTPIQADDGHLYGSSFKGGADDLGAIYRYDIGLDSFSVATSMTTALGENPQAGLYQASNGLIYGTADLGGANGLGTMFSYNPVSGAANTVIDFDFEGTGYSSYATPVQAADGTLYVPTRLGAAGEDGALLTYNPAGGTSGIATRFNLAVDGRDPLGGLLLASDGLLYGVTHKGGIYNDGTLFSVDPSDGSFAKVADFDDSLTGSRPRTTLIQAADGLLYGTALNGGIYNDGTIFSYDLASGILTKRIDLHTAVSGKRPGGGLTEVGGLLYGITEQGGLTLGTIFEFDPATDGLIVVHQFDPATGLNAQGSLLAADDGLLYGVTDSGGPFGNGVLYSLEPGTATYTVEHPFNASAGTGATARCQPVQAADGLLYGATSNGGPAGEGVVYSYDISTNTYSAIANLDPAVYGEDPIGRLMEASNGNIYGVTNINGPGAGGGTLFEFDPMAGTAVVKHDFEEPDADDPWMSPTEAPNCVPSFTALVDSACTSYTTPSGTVVTTSGVYYDTLTSTLGCDSVFEITLGIIDLDTLVTSDATSITAVQTGVSYQWVDCDNGNSPIAGETGQTFVPTSSGNYAVELTNGPCSGISECVSFTVGVGIETPLASLASLYPNPASTRALLDLPAGHYQIALTDVQGRVLWQSGELFGNRFEIPVEQLNSGLYLLQVTSPTEEIMLKLSRE